MVTLIVVLYVTASFGLLIYSANCYALLALFLRRRTQNRGEAGRHGDYERENGGVPIVTTQIPIYNEANVAERALRAVAAIEYPLDRHQIQVLDDSTDETRAIVDRTAQELRDAGHWIDVVRRRDRSGFKAGALAAGLGVARGELIAIFDADFVPPQDFLARTVPFFAKDDKLGIVQARWGHLNDEESILTRAQAIGIDGHFMIEQSARTFNGLLMNFNGTAGVWRRQAIDEAGGWEGDTLTEDLDLSYRAQLAGWRTHYLADVVAPAELPPTVTAFKSQQFRWAKGSMQTAVKLLPRIWRSRYSPWVKLQAALHLTHYAVHPLMLVVAMLAAPVMWLVPEMPRGAQAAIVGMILISMMGPNSLYLTSQRMLYPNWWQRIAWFPALMCIGVGIAVSNTRAVIEALVGRESEFVRTPKRGDGAKAKTYRVKTPILPWIELTLGAYCTISLCAYLSLGKLVLSPFLFVYAAGFTIIGIAGLRESRNGAVERQPSAPLRFPRPAGAQRHAA